MNNCREFEISAGLGEPAGTVHVPLAAEACRMTPKMMHPEATARPAFRPQRSTMGPTIGPPKMHPALIIAELRPVRSLLR